MRIMYDGIGADANAIRYSAWLPGNLVGYYATPNQYAWSQGQKNLFPPSALVSITIDATVFADVLDVESGGALPSQAYGWIQMEKAAGYFKPTIYCNMSTVGSVIALTGKYVHGVDYDIWIADWDGSSTNPLPYAVAKQAVNTSNWDKSFVYDDGWPHRTVPGPVVPVQPPHLFTGVAGSHDFTGLGLKWTRVAGDVSHYVLCGPNGERVRATPVQNVASFTYRAGKWELFAIIRSKPCLVTSFTLP